MMRHHALLLRRIPWPKTNGRITTVAYSATSIDWEQAAAEELYQDYIRAQADSSISGIHGTKLAGAESLLSPSSSPGLVSEERPSLPTFHELSGGGYSGRLAQAFRRPAQERAPHILAVAQTMQRAGEPPSSTLAYNYILSALLETGQRREAFRLLREMETRGLSPDLFTFEQVLFDLSRDLSLAITVEELVHLLRNKYGLCLSSSCWTSRLRVWLGRRQEPRVLALFEEMRQTDRRAAADPALYISLIKTALVRNTWEVASHLLSCLTPTVPLMEEIEKEYVRPGIRTTNPPVILTASDYQTLLLSKVNGLGLRHVPFVRYFMRQLTGITLDEGCYVRLLYFAAGTGRSVADLAYLSLSQLARIYRGDQFRDGNMTKTLLPGACHPDGSQRNSLSLPRPYLEAYVECLERERPPNWWSENRGDAGEAETEEIDPSTFFTTGLRPQHQELAERVRSVLCK